MVFDMNIPHLRWDMNIKVRACPREDGVETIMVSTKRRVYIDSDIEKRLMRDIDSRLARSCELSGGAPARGCQTLAQSFPCRVT